MEMLTAAQSLPSQSTQSVAPTGVDEVVVEHALRLEVDVTSELTRHSCDTWTRYRADIHETPPDTCS
jgi:hypothetical protein